MTREDHLKLFKEYVGKPKEELDAIINTGMFNSIIIAASSAVLCTYFSILRIVFCQIYTTL